MSLTIAQRGAAWMAGKLEAVSGQAVKYRRGTADVELTAVPARRTSEDYGADGSLIVSTNHDWLLDKARLVIDGEAIEPRRGDLIITADGQTFVVVPAEAENCWRWTDQYRQRIRVHTIERMATGEDG